MSKTCKNCGYRAEDGSVFCPACGTVYESVTVDPGAPAPSDPVSGRYARPVNAGTQTHYATPLQMTRPAQPAPVDPAFSKPKKVGRLPYILMGVGAAAVIFTILLIVILSSGDGLAGKYIWTSSSDGATGSMQIFDDGTALFMVDGSGSVSLRFDTERQTVTYTGSNGEVAGTYRQDGNDLYVTFEGYTDMFKKQ